MAEPKLKITRNRDMQITGIAFNGSLSTSDKIIELPYDFHFPAEKLYDLIVHFAALEILKFGIAINSEDEVRDYLELNFDYHIDWSQINE